MDGSRDRVATDGEEFVVAGAEGTVLKIDDTETNTEDDYACATLSGDYLCVMCSISGARAWPGEGGDTHRSR